MTGRFYRPDPLVDDYTDVELEVARRMKLLGLPWEPQVGHHVYDESGKLEAGLPPIRRIFVLTAHEDDDLVGAFGGEQGVRREGVWLPSSEDSHRLLRELGLSGEAVLVRLRRDMSEGGLSERLSLYRQLEEALSAQTENWRNA